MLKRHQIAHIRLQLSSQIARFTQHQAADEAYDRCAMLVASLLEDTASAACPRSVIHPFGSALNSFGKITSDIDFAWAIYG